MNTILHSNINLFEEIMKPNSQIKPLYFLFSCLAMLLNNTFCLMFCRYTDFLFKISTIPLKAFCRIGFIEMLIRYCYSIVLNELCGCKYKCCNTIHDSRSVISEYPKLYIEILAFCC